MREQLILLKYLILGSLIKSMGGIKWCFLRCSTFKQSKESLVMYQDLVIFEKREKLLIFNIHPFPFCTYFNFSEIII